MKRRTTIKLLLFITLLFFTTGQLGGCLKHVTKTDSISETVAKTGSISGTVTDATTGLGLSGVNVKAGELETTTGTNGTYKLENVPTGTQTVTASKEGYINDSQQVAVTPNQETPNVNFALSPVPQTGSTPETVTETGSISGTVVDATTGLGLSGVTVKAGGVQATTGTNGTYKLENVPAVTQTVTALKTGYITDSQQVVVTADQETTNVNFALSPALQSGQIRIVLTWGTNPEDLDSYLLVPQSNTNGTLGYTVYYRGRGTQTVYPYALLDVDDRDGYGPETITIYQRLNQKYKYFVYNPTGSRDLPTSGAVVKVYSGASLLRTYNVPATQTPGLYWYVFDINGDGSITDVNRIQASAPTLP